MKPASSPSLGSPTRDVSDGGSEGWIAREPERDIGDDCGGNQSRLDSGRGRRRRTRSGEQNYWDEKAERASLHVNFIRMETVQGLRIGTGNE